MFTASHKISSARTFDIGSRQLVLGAVAVMTIIAAPASFAQERAGRFTMSPIDGGFARLDTETGAMSLCKAQPKDSAAASGWNCAAMGDSATDAQAQDKARKLESENKELRAEVKRMEDLLGLNGEKPKSDGKQAEQRPGGNPGGLNLPSEQDIDKALSYMERMVKKFQDTMKRLEGSDSRRGIAL